MSGLLLVAEEPVLAGMRVERRHGDPRRPPPVSGRIARSARRIFDRIDVLAQQVEHPPQGDVERHVDDAQAGGPRRGRVRRDPSESVSR